MMKITVVQQVLEGLVDDDYQPIVYSGHLNKEQCTFVKKLQRIGDLPVPKGHLRRNKGITSYFFDPEKRTEIEEFLKSCGLSNSGQVACYVEESILWKDENRRVILHTIDSAWVSVALIRWPA